MGMGMGEKDDGALIRYATPRGRGSRRGTQAPPVRRLGTWTGGVLVLAAVDFDRGK
jgi:hypothetical protein